MKNVPGLSEQGGLVETNSRWGSVLLVAFLVLSPLLAIGQFTLSFEKMDLMCYGIPQGSITVNPVGGAAPYTYQWSNGATTQTIEGLLAGTYSVTVTDNTNATATGSVTLTQPDIIGAIVTKDVCEAPFTITVEATGGEPPYRYRWDTGQDGNSITVTEERKYCVTITDAAMCGRVECVPVELVPVDVDVEATDVTCPGAEDGMIEAFPEGGEAPFTYAWSNGDSGKKITGLAPGTYTVTLTDDNGCTATATRQVIDQGPFTTIIDAIDPTCAGEMDGFVAALPNGGTAPYTYLWNTGATTQALIGLSAGGYAVTVTDDNGCTAEANVLLIEQSNLSLKVSGTDETCPEFEDGTAVAVPSDGLPPYQYDWSNGQTSSSINGLPPGVYSVTVTDQAGCEATGQYTVEAATEFTLRVSGTDVSTCDAMDGTARVEVLSGEPPFSYEWSNGETVSVITGLGPGTYTVTVTNGTECEAIGSVTITEPPSLTVEINGSSLVCENLRDGSATAMVIGGMPPFDYLWNTGDTTATITDLAAGTYSVTVTDVNGCSDDASITIQEAEAPELIIESTNIVCGGESEGEINLNIEGGEEPYAIVWNNGSEDEDQSDLGSGTYSVTVTDANGCSSIAETTITVVEDIILEVTVRDLLCNGDNSGGAILNITGGDAPYEVEWSTGDSGMQIAGVPAGSYSVVVTDSNGCTATELFEIMEPDALLLDLDATDLVCEGEADGLIQATVSGGTPAYTFEWSNGANTEDLADLPAGTYTLTVTDQNECIATASVTIEEADGPEVTIEATDMVCGGEDQGMAEAIVTGGTAPFEYLWPNGETSAAITGLGTGTYTVTVTDANGCLDSASVNIIVNGNILIDIVAQDVLCFGDSTGSATATASGGAEPYVYEWSNGQIGADLTGVPAGMYMVTVTDGNECTAISSITITEPTELTLQLQGTNIICEASGSGVVSAQPSGGSQPYFYSWNNGASTAVLENLDGGTYEVTVTDNAGCTITGSFTIEEAPNPQLSLDATEMVCDGQNNGTIDATVTSGTSPFSYEWSNGANTEDLSGLGTGTYILTVTDANGCTAIDSASILILDGIDVAAEPIDVACNGESSGGVTLTVDGGMEPYTYEWSNGQTTADLINVPAGTYTVTVTDSAACTGTAEVSIAEPPAIAISFEKTDLDCGADSTGSTTVLVSGGTSPYSFEWDNGASTQTIENLPAGTYSVTVTDQNECTATAMVSILDPGVLQCTIEVVSPPSFPGSTDGVASVTARNGTPPYTYLWSNGQTDSIATDLSTGPVSVTVTDDLGCTTICDLPTLTPEGALVGDYTWLDANRDGIQDEEEMPLPGVLVIITAVTEDSVFIDSMFTDENGLYLFQVPPGDYKITFLPPSDTLAPTAANQGADDSVDSDISLDSELMTEVFTLEAGDEDLTRDAGWFGGPDITNNPCVCLNNATDEDDGQFGETVVVKAATGETWVVIEQMGMSTLDSPDPPGEPIDVPLGTELEEVETGVYELRFRHIDELGYSVVVSNGRHTLSIENTCFYPTVELENIDEELILCTNDDPFVPEVITSEPGTVEFFLNGESIDTIYPAELEVGETNVLEVVFTPDTTVNCDGRVLYTVFTVVDGCSSKLGDYVWLDKDEDGIQDANEQGIGGVRVILKTPDGEGGFVSVDTTFTDQSGMYMFEVDSGAYKLCFLPPNEFYLATKQFQGSNDSLDSNVDPLTLMSDVVTIGWAEENPTIDAGFFLDCIPLTDPGVIGFDQMICAPGNDPDPIVNVELPSGGVGEIEYLWMKSTTSARFDATYYEPIPNTNSPEYDPGPLFETTYFNRCARIVGCPRWIEPQNPVKITVKDDAMAEIEANKETVCLGETITLEAITKTSRPVISWHGPDLVLPSGSSGRFLTIEPISTADFTVTLTVTENGCTAANTYKVVVVDGAPWCVESNSFAIEAEPMQDEQKIRLDWTAPNDGLTYTFAVQTSTDKETYETIAEVTTPFDQTEELRYYYYIDAKPKMGNNFYRVELIPQNPGLEKIMSDEVQAVLRQGEKTFMIYPNPATDVLFVEFLEQAEVGITIELMQTNGSILRSFRLPPDSFKHELPIGDLPEGLYFMRVNIGGQDTEVVKMIKR